MDGSSTFIARHQLNTLSFGVWFRDSRRALEYKLIYHLECNMSRSEFCLQILEVYFCKFFSSYHITFLFLFQSLCPIKVLFSRYNFVSIYFYFIFAHPSLAQIDIRVPMKVTHPWCMHVSWAWIIFLMKGAYCGLCSCSTLPHLCSFQRRHHVWCHLALTPQINDKELAPL